MPKYFKLCSGMSQMRTEAKPECSWKVEYFCQEGERVSSICEYESGIIYLSPALSAQQRQKGRSFRVPVEALPCAATEYEAAHQRLQGALQKKEEEQRKQKALAALLKTGRLYAPQEPVQRFLDDFTVFDTETTGLSPEQDRLLEVAAVRYQNWQPVAHMQRLVRFTGQLNYFVTNLTGLTSADVRHAPESKAVLREFRHVAGESLLIGHNVAFDLRMIEAERARLGAVLPLPNATLCTKLAAQSRYPGPHKLGALCERFGISTVGAHRAMADVLMTFELLRYLHQQQPLRPSLVGAASAARAKKASVQPSLFAA